MLPVGTTVWFLEPAPTLTPRVWTGRVISTDKGNGMVVVWPHEGAEPAFLSEVDVYNDYDAAYAAAVRRSGRRA